jgi:hypothetical protein
MGSWAREGEHENQIKEEGEVEHGEADQNPTSPALERTGLPGLTRVRIGGGRGVRVEQGVERRETRAGASVNFFRSVDQTDLVWLDLMPRLGWAS